VLKIAKICREEVLARARYLLNQLAIIKRHKLLHLPPFLIDFRVLAPGSGDASREDRYVIAVGLELHEGISAVINDEPLLIDAEAATSKIQRSSPSVVA
jgi:hypothetical protein